MSLPVRRRQRLREAAELVVEEGAAGERQLAELLARDRDQALVAVTEVERGVAREAVEVAATVDVDHPGAVALGEHHRQGVVVVRGVALGGLDVLGGAGARGDVGRGHEHMVPPPTGERRVQDARTQTRPDPTGSGLVVSVELRGLEPLTLCMPCRCATSCATAPTSSPSVVLKDNAENISRRRRPDEIRGRRQVSQRTRSQTPSTVAAMPARSGTTISARAPVT